MTECTWKLDERSELITAWETSCGNLLCLEAGTPEENKFQFCPYCGGKLKQGENRETK